MLSRLLLGLCALGAVLCLVGVALTPNATNAAPPKETRAPVPVDHVTLAAYATRYQTKRLAINIETAIEALNGAVIAPNKSLSVNERLGERSAERGYVELPVQVRDKLVDKFGGGVHQAASTLHAAALLAGLEISEWHAADFAPEYIDPGFEAVVVHGFFDLRITNRFSFPVTVQASAGKGRLEVSILGAEDPYAVRITFEELRAPQLPTKYIFREDWKRGRQKVIVTGSPSYEFQRIRILENRSRNTRIAEPRQIRYKAVEKVVEIGTGGQMTEACPMFLKDALYAKGSG
jgi:vancomycin resistance protein YoaR